VLFARFAKMLRQRSFKQETWSPRKGVKKPLYLRSAQEGNYRMIMLLSELQRPGRVWKLANQYTRTCSAISKLAYGLEMWLDRNGFSGISANPQP